MKGRLRRRWAGTPARWSSAPAASERVDTRRVRGLVRGDVVLVREREADVVEAVQEPVRAGRVELEGDRLAVRARRSRCCSRSTVISEPASPIDQLHQLLHLLGGKRDRDEPDLDAVRDEDVRERRRDERPRSRSPGAPRARARARSRSRSSRPASRIFAPAKAGLLSSKSGGGSPPRRDASRRRARFRSRSGRSASGTAWGRSGRCRRRARSSTATRPVVFVNGFTGRLPGL